MICNFPGPWTHRTNGPMSAVALGPVIIGTLHWRPFPPRYDSEKTSRSLGTIFLPWTITICLRTSMLIELDKLFVTEIQTDPVAAIAQNAVVIQIGRAHV